MGNYTQVITDGVWVPYNHETEHVNTTESGMMLQNLGFFNSIMGSIGGIMFKKKTANPIVIGNEIFNPTPDASLGEDARLSFDALV